MRKLITLGLTALLAGAPSAQALDFDFQGNFTKDNDVVILNFTVGAPSVVTVFSSSWLNPPDGTGVPTGGFDPILAIWSSAGTLLSEQDDGGVIGNTMSNGVSYAHGTWDSYYQVTLAAGAYKASITQYNNFAAGTTLAAGFSQDGNPNFTTTWGQQPNFNGVWEWQTAPDPRTSFWRFHLLNVEEASQQPVPDGASTFALLTMALMAAFGLRRRLR